jgi:hypothetical protein
VRLFTCALRSTATLFAVVMNALVHSQALASWPQDSTINVPICAGPARHTLTPIVASIVSDGHSGAIVAMNSELGTADIDICAQRIDSAGFVRWSTNGVPVCIFHGDQFNVSLAPDGAGGAILAWTDDRSPVDSIFAQRVGADGVPQWISNGKSLSSVSGVNPEVTSDGEGGAIVAFESGAHILAQRVGPSGVTRWTDTGALVCAAPGLQYGPDPISDGAGGAIFTWTDTRNGTYDIYAQRIDSTGHDAWQSDGVVVCAAAGDQRGARLAPDGRGGAIIVWKDERGGSPFNVYAQRLNASGIVLWQTDGVPLCSSASSDEYFPGVASDGASGAIAAWHDRRNGGYDIFAQRVDSSGTLRWAAAGLPVCVAPGDQIYPHIVSDGLEGAILTWDDARLDQGDIYAQRISSDGAPLWQSNGIAVCTASGPQQRPSLIASANHAAILVWNDGRPAGVNVNGGVYAQGLDSHGQLGGAKPQKRSLLQLEPALPNPSQDVVTFRFTLPQQANVRLVVRDLEGRQIAIVTQGGVSGGVHTVKWSARGASGSRPRSGVYFAELTAGQQTLSRRFVLVQ